MADEIGKTLLDADYSSVSNVLAGILLILIIVLFIFLVIGIIFLILNIIGKWKMFKKSGEAGWKALIPIYSTYTQCEIVGVTPWWLVVILICYFIGNIFSPLELLGKIASIYFLVIISISTARSFGKSDGFGVGIFLLSPIFYMILGFDNSKYEGKKPTGDLLSSVIDNNTSSTKEETTVSKNNSERKKKITKKSTTPKKKTTTTKKNNTTKKSTKQSAKKSTTKKTTKK